jgi:hypothetical protein
VREEPEEQDEQEKDEEVEEEELGLVVTALRARLQRSSRAFSL